MKLILSILLCCTSPISGDWKNHNIQVCRKLHEEKPRFNLQADSDYRNFLETTDIYIDKSTFVKKIIKMNEKFDGNAISIAAPKQWGKSTLLKMLQFFHQPELDENLQMKSHEKTIAYSFFSDGKLKTNESEITFDRKPLLSQDFTFVKEYCAKNPVFLFDFATLQFRDTFKGFLAEFNLQLNLRMQKYVGIFQKLCENETNAVDNQVFVPDIVRSYCNDVISILNTSNSSEINNEHEERLSRSFRIIGTLLQVYFQASPVILINEPEKVYSNLYIPNPGTEGVQIRDDQKQKIKDFYSKFLLITFKTFDLVPPLYTLTTGITPFSHSTANCISQKSYLDEDICDYFGIPASIASSLLNLVFNETIKQKATFTYSGYGASFQNLYNPWSVMQAINDKKIDDFWRPIGTFHYDLKLVTNEARRNDLIRVLKEDCIQYVQHRSLRTANIFSYIAKDLNLMKTNAPSTYFYLHLLHHGYLNLRNVSYDESLVIPEKVVVVSKCFIIPNSECRRQIYSILLQNKIQCNHIESACHAMFELLTTKAYSANLFIKEFIDVLVKDNTKEIITKESQFFYEARLLDIARQTAHMFGFKYSPYFGIGKTPNNTTESKANRFPDLVIFNETHVAIFAMEFNKFIENLESIFNTQLKPYSWCYKKEHPSVISMRLVIINVKSDIRETEAMELLCKNNDDFDDLEKFANNVIT